MIFTLFRHFPSNIWDAFLTTIWFSQYDWHNHMAALTHKFLPSRSTVTIHEVHVIIFVFFFLYSFNTASATAARTVCLIFDNFFRGPFFAFNSQCPLMGIYKRSPNLWLKLSVIILRLKWRRREPIFAVFCVFFSSFFFCFSEQGQGHMFVV